MISELMSIYDTNIQGNKNVTSSNSSVTENQSLPQLKIQPQQESYFHGQGVVMEGNFYEESNIHNNHQMFPREENQFDRFKALNAPFDTNHNSSNFQMMYGSPFDLPPFDYKEEQQGVAMDTLTKQPDISIWYQ